MADRPPLALSDDELEIVHDYAKPLLPGLRGKFLERVADLLHSERGSATASSHAPAGRRRKKSSSSGLQRQRCR